MAVITIWNATLTGTCLNLPEAEFYLQTRVSGGKIRGLHARYRVSCVAPKSATAMC